MMTTTTTTTTIIHEAWKVGCEEKITERGLKDLRKDADRLTPRPGRLITLIVIFEEQEACH